MKKILTYCILLVTIIVGCRKDNFDRMSSADQEAYADMEDAWSKAQMFEDSLVYCSGTGSPCSQAYIDYCDSMFHYHVNRWNTYHSNFNHDNSHCDHYHNGGGMHHHGHYNEHNNDEGHHEYHHDRMDELMHDHEPYHP